MSLLDDLVSGDGLSPIHGIIWMALGVWALIGTPFYIPAKRKQDNIYIALKLLKLTIINFISHSVIRAKLPDTLNSYK